MAFCSKGHYYDDGKHDGCPLCAGGGAAPATIYEGDEGPVPEAVKARALPPLKPMNFAGGRMGARPGQPIAPMGGRGIPQAAGGKTILDDEDEAIERLMGFLVVVSSREEEEHRFIRLQKGVNAIGRFGSRAAIELRDGEVSTNHALVICTNNASRIVDLDSANGLQINGEKTEIALLEEGTQITLGRTTLVHVPFPFVAED